MRAADLMHKAQGVNVDVPYRYSAPMYVNISMTHYRPDEDGNMEPDPDSQREVFEKVFLAKVCEGCCDDRRVAVLGLLLRRTKANQISWTISHSNLSNFFTFFSKTTL